MDHRGTSRDSVQVVTFDGGSGAAGAGSDSDSAGGLDRVTGRV